MRMWMVRSKRGQLAEEFESLGVVAIWYGIREDLSRFGAERALRDHLAQLRIGGNRTVVTSVFSRYLFEMHAGDHVVSYDGGTREYLIGLLGDYRYDESLFEEPCHARQVTWQGRVSRDDLTQSAKNSLNSLLTVFRIRDDVAAELLAPQQGRRPDVDNKVTPTAPPDDDMTDDLEQVAERAQELVKDLVIALNPEQMEELVAGVLRAMGYKTRVSPKGPDRGRDIMASPDGLGLEHPRIIVEVKHRRGAMGSDVIRGLSGALTATDRGLFVSTGGFTREARYEADRANPPIALLDVDDLVRLLTEHYPSTDSTTKALIPLQAVYWPI